MGSNGIKVQGAWAGALFSGALAAERVAQSHLLQPDIAGRPLADLRGKGQS